MSYYYDLCCLDCNVEIPIVSENRNGANFMYNMEDVPQFVVDHAYHKLVVKGETSVLRDGKIIDESDGWR